MIIVTFLVKDLNFKNKFWPILARIIPVLTLFIMLQLSINAFAQNSSAIDEQTRNDILEIIDIIQQKAEEQNQTHYLLALPTDQSSSEEALHIYRIRSIEGLERGDTDSYKNAIQKLGELASQLGDNRNLKFIQILEEYIELDRRQFTPAQEEQVLARLRNFQNDQDWYVRNAAMLHESLIQTRMDNLDIALNLATNALEIIPTDRTNYYTQEAIYETNLLISFLYLFSADLELATPIIREYINESEKVGRRLDGLILLNNINYALQSWREFELSKIAAEIAYKMAADETAINRARTIFRYSQALNALGNFDKALSISEEGLGLAQDDIYDLLIRSEYTIALAGTGQAEAALHNKAKLMASLETLPSYQERFVTRLAIVDTLMAKTDHDTDKVYALMNEQLTYETQRLLRDSSAETKELLGTLNNQKTIQAEREEKLLLERSLAVARADAATKRNLFLTFIIAIMAIIVALAFLFAAYQRRVAERSAELQSMAEAGERAKSRFLAVMSHELRTPLNGIIGLADMLAREGPTQEVRAKNNVILKSGLSLLDLLSNILDMTQMENGKLSIQPVATNIRELADNIRQLWEGRASQQAISFTMHVEEDVPHYLEIDPLRVRQCLENLISNAIKFTSNGRAHIHISYGASPHQSAPLNKKREAKKSASSISENDYLTIFVADTGKGMSEQETATIFAPFTQADNSTTRQFGGSGLGLAITSSLARLMQGDISVNSYQGRGSEFTLSIKAPRANNENQVNLNQLLPSTKQNILATENQVDKTDSKALKDCASADPEQTQRSDPEFITFGQHDKKNTQSDYMDYSKDSLAGLNVLVVDDIVSNHDVLKIFLKSAKCYISSAMDGVEAVQAAQTQLFDIILMDIRMPNMDGIEATKRIRRISKHYANIPIIAMTADISASNNAECIAAGASVFLTKPVVSTELFGAINFVRSPDALDASKILLTAAEKPALEQAI